MRKLILAIVALLALFSALRAFPQGETGGLGVQLHQGLVEIGDGSASVGLAFGVMDGSDSPQWSLLPLRMVYRNGDRSLSVGLNGLSFLLSGGFSVGRPQRISSPRIGDVISIGGRVTVDSRVDGDVWAMGADVQLTPRADVTGDVVALGGRVIAAGGAVVRGSVSQEPRSEDPLPRSPGHAVFRAGAGIRPAFPDLYPARFRPLSFQLLSFRSREGPLSGFG